MIYCNKCGSDHLIRKGYRNDKQIYKCKNCGYKTSNPKDTPNVDGDSVSETDYSTRVIFGHEKKIERLENELNLERKKTDYLGRRLSIFEKSGKFVELMGTGSKGVTIKPSFKNSNEACAVICLSDLHLEEDVDPTAINGLNEYNTKISEQRFINVIHNAAKLIKISNMSIKITNCILFWGGDIISGFIHDELAETNHLSPNKAIIFAHRLLKWSLDFLTNEFKDLSFKVVCCYGNHGRSTQKYRIQNASDHNWEYLLYKFIEREYKDVKQVTFQVSEGYHNIVDVFGKFKVRFHHGDWVKYNGGVGGIHVPLNKKINEWNKAIHVNLDVMGHFHTLIYGPNYVVNGSLIGYNAFAVSIGASPEPPAQAFFLIDKEKNRKTATFPIFTD